MKQFNLTSVSDAAIRAAVAQAKAHHKATAARPGDEGRSVLLRTERESLAWHVSRRRHKGHLRIRAKETTKPQ